MYSKTRLSGVTAVTPCCVVRSDECPVRPCYTWRGGEKRRRRMGRGSRLLYNGNRNKRLIFFFFQSISHGDIPTLFSSHLIPYLLQCHLGLFSSPLKEALAAAAAAAMLAPISWIAGFAAFKMILAGKPFTSHGFQRETNNLRANIKASLQDVHLHQEAVS